MQHVLGGGGKEMVLVARRKVASATVKLMDGSLTAFLSVLTYHQQCHEIKLNQRYRPTGRERYKERNELRGWEFNLVILPPYLSDHNQISFSMRPTTLIRSGYFQTELTCTARQY